MFGADRQGLALYGGPKGVGVPKAPADRETSPVMLEDGRKEIPLMRALLPLLFAGVLAVAQSQGEPAADNQGLVPPEKWDAVAKITTVMSKFILIGRDPGKSN